MTTFPALPSATSCLTPAIDVLVDNPANTIPGYGSGTRIEHINYGVGNWARVLKGWQAQATLNLRRAADEMMQSRLPLASGQGLRELAASKFFVNVIDNPTAAIGAAVVAFAGPAGSAGGKIPAGTRFRRTANPTAVPVPLNGAEWLSTADVLIPDSTGQGDQFTVPIQAAATGVAGNITIEHGYNVIPLVTAPGGDITIVDALYQPFTVVQVTAGGGSTSFSDVEVQAIAGAQPQGRRGPTEGAIYAGSYLALGVRHVAVFEDLTNANTVVFVADESWGSDTAFWQPAVIQLLLGASNATHDPWAGFGCSLNSAGAGTVDNIYLNIAATVQLRSQQLLQNTQGIQAAITSKLNDYFNLRPDWYTYRDNAIRGIIARADPRILTCSALTITNRFGQTLTQPPAIPTGTAPTSVSHYDLLTLSPTFIAPL